jgi:hypothetical protein
MSSFTQARFEPTGASREGRPVFRVRGRDGDGLHFYIGFKGSGLSVHVPEGFETDGPSIPSTGLAGLLCRIIPQSAIERAMKSAAVHDLLCEDARFDRSAADAEFWAAMSVEGTPSFWRWVFFNAVITNRSKQRFNREISFDGELRPGVPGPG